MSNTYTVELTYFKSTGKFYSEGTYITTKKEIFEIFNEVKDLQRNLLLPNLMDGCGNSFFIQIYVPGHPNNYPNLILPLRKEKKV